MDKDLSKVMKTGKKLLRGADPEDLTAHGSEFSASMLALSILMAILVLVLSLVFGGCSHGTF